MLTPAAAPGATVCMAASAAAQTPVGALAIDERQGDQYGWAVDYETAGSAQAAALRECGAGCSVVLTFERCAAYAADQDADSTAVGWAESYSSSAAAQQSAVGECSSWKWQLKKGPLRPREKGPPVGSVSTSTLLRHSETAHPAPRAGNPPSPTPIPSRRFRSGAAFGVRWRAGSLGRCGRSGRARPGRAARPITAIRAAGRAVCHPKGRSGAEDARSALTRRPSRSYAAPTSRQACRASRGRVRTEEHDPTGINGLRMPAPGSPSWPPTGSCRRRSSRHARSPWAARQPPAPTDPDRLLEQLRGRGPGEGFRQRVPPLPVLVLQRQERLHRVVPLLWPRSPVRRPAVPGPGLAGLQPLPVTRLPLRVRQRHDYSTLLRNGPVSGGSAPGRSGPTG